MRHATGTTVDQGAQGLRAAFEALLARSNIIGPQERACARAIEEALPDAAALTSLAAGPRGRLGEMLRSVGRIGPDEVADVLVEQERTGELFGDLLVRRGHVSLAERDVAVDFQNRQQVAQPDASPLRLGEILVAAGKVPRAALDDALARQRSTGRRLGEELIAASHATAADVEAAVSIQQRLVAIALALALAAAAGAPAPVMASEGASQAKSSVNFVVRIPVVVRLHPISQGDSVTVTAADIERGFVEVPAGSRFELIANAAHTMHFSAQGGWFRAVKVSGLGGDLTLGPSGGEFLQAHRLPSPEIHELDYRFELGPDAVPGRYAWPLALSVSSA